MLETIQRKDKNIISLLLKKILCNINSFIYRFLLILFPSDFLYLNINY